MGPSAEPPPPPPPPNEKIQSSTVIPPDVPLRSIVEYPFFAGPDLVKAGPEEYFPSKKEMGLYVGKLRESLQTLVQGPLDYRLTSTMNTWKSSPSGIQQRDFDNAASLTIAALDAGTFQTSTSKPLLGSEDWGTLASACLAAIGRGFTRPLKEVSHKGYTEFWESLEDNPQCKLDEGESDEFHSLLQRLKATVQQLDMHINADEADGIRKWASTTCKEIEETVRRAALVEVESALHSWKLDQCYKLFSLFPLLYDTIRPAPKRPSLYGLYWGKF